MPPSSNTRRTRIAPSLTGPLHLGHARTFLLTWALARHEGWRVLLRLEDLDRSRLRPGMVEETVEILAWLGIDWDEGPLLQSEELGPCHAAMARLAEQRRVFACGLSRREIRAAAAAPHGPGGELRFDPALRPPPGDAWHCGDPRRSYRLRVDPGEVGFHDELAGAQRFDPAAECGDFVVWTREGLPSYQLAVVVDDARSGVSEVVRGEDLLGSTARQILLQRALDLPTPRWWHLPLVADAAGVRLAKRDGALSIAALRAAGASRERILGLVAAWCRWIPQIEPIGLDAFRGLVDAERLQALAVHEADPANRPRLDAATIAALAAT
jgi:glutamyl-tRNA synthetase